MIHPTADVSNAAHIGNNVKIWHQAQVREDASIGDNSIIGKNVYIDKKVVIGNNCKIQNNSSLYRGLVVENSVFIGPHTVTTNDKCPRAINPDRTLKQDTDWQEGKILIKEGASIGARTVILSDITIGRFALVGAGAVVTKDVPDYGLVFGNPAKMAGYVCRCGRKLESEKKAGDYCASCCGSITKIRKI